MITLLLEDEQWYAVQHSAADVPYCDCGGAAADGDSCFRCGRYVRDLFVPGSLIAASESAYWQRFLRERPHEHSGVLA